MKMKRLNLLILIAGVLVVGSLVFVIYFWKENVGEDEIDFEQGNGEIIPAIKENCAKEGEKFSRDYKKYLEHCCEGLTEWYSGLDTSISIENKCYETGMTAGVPVGTCINCENGVCENIEDVCNCPQDCKNRGNSQYSTIKEFCEERGEQFKEACKTTLIKNFPICSLCEDDTSLILNITEPIENSIISTDFVFINTTTSDDATCKYSWTRRFLDSVKKIPYRVMNITNGIYHSQLLEDLEYGHYTIKLNCTDELGNSQVNYVNFKTDRMYPDMYNLTERRKKFIGDNIGAGLYDNDLPNLLIDGSISYVDGIYAQFIQILGIGSKQIENSTSNGDLNSPQVLIEVGTDYNEYLFHYELKFSKAVNFSKMYEGEPILMLGNYYKVQEGSTNDKIIFKKKSDNKEMILEDNQSITVNGGIVNGTKAKIDAREEGVLSIEVYLAMQNPNKDYIAVGEYYDDSVFDALRLNFKSYSNEAGAEIYLESVMSRE